jgi:predicted metalloprotease
MLILMVLIFLFSGKISTLFGGGNSLPESRLPAPESSDVFADVFRDINASAKSPEVATQNRQGDQSAADIFDTIIEGKTPIGKPVGQREASTVLNDILQSSGSQNLDVKPINRYSNDVDADFVTAILGSTEDVWRAIFPRGQYRAPSLVLYDGRTPTACGGGSAASGPFYCPADQKVYLDTDFFKELARIGGKGDFAQAYVIGHEVAHHIQGLTGTSQRMRRLQRQYPRSKNQLSVMLELQADCLAGVWAYHSHKSLSWLEVGDIQEGLNAASAIGDDRITRGMVSAESFTHGSSKQRQEWLMRGVNSGDVRNCNTFKAMANLDGF